MHWLSFYIGGAIGTGSMGLISKVMGINQFHWFKIFLAMILWPLEILGSFLAIMFGVMKPVKSISTDGNHVTVEVEVE